MVQRDAVSSIADALGWAKLGGAWAGDGAAAELVQTRDRARIRFDNPLRLASSDSVAPDRGAGGCSTSVTVTVIIEATRSGHPDRSWAVFEARVGYDRAATCIARGEWRVAVAVPDALEFARRRAREWVAAFAGSGWRAMSREASLASLAPYEDG